MKSRTIVSDLFRAENSPDDSPPKIQLILKAFELNDYNANLEKVTAKNLPLELNKEKIFTRLTLHSQVKPYK